jgi:hypothetical protein
MIHA